MITSLFKKKTVLITGHTGFKGSWLAAWLTKNGAKVIGVSSGLVSQPNNFETLGLKTKIIDYRFNILNSKKLTEVFQKHKPDFVFHLAAQSLVNKSLIDPMTTWKTNIMGTATILECLSGLSKTCNAVIITSDKCYENSEWCYGYRENDRLGGKDPYSASKAAAELVFHSYVNSFFKEKKNIRVASARAGNVIGGGDWAGDRLIPDCVRAWSKKEVVSIRNPKSTRPWQHVLEPLCGYLYLAKFLAEGNSSNGESYNFGPAPEQNFDVETVVTEMSKHWENVNWTFTQKGENSKLEAGLLKLCCDKAFNDLNWKPRLNFNQTIELTIDWYKTYYENPKMASVKTLEQINYFENLLSGSDIG